MLKSHRKRVMTSVVLLPLLTLLVISGSARAWTWVLLGASVLGLWEYYSLFWPQSRTMLKWAALVPAAFILFRQDLDLSLAALLVGGFWGASLCFLGVFSRGHQSKPADVPIVISGWIYLPVALHWVLFLQQIEIVLILVITFLSDIGAYYFGRFLGKKKIWPQISPNKTWAGALGGVCSAYPFCIVLGLCWGQAPWFHWLWIPLALNAAAQLGDFFESGLKRQLGVKDSGILLPGHGGFLDRIDSLLLVLPVYMGIRTLIPLF